MTEIRLFQGDCLKILPDLADMNVDALITDPPYGVKFVCGSPDGRIQDSAMVRHRTPIVGDDKPFDPSPLLHYRIVVLFGANNYANRLPPSRGWIFWHKRPRMKPNDYGDGELIWTNQDHPIKYFEYLWNGVLQAGEKGRPKFHPSQKPESLMVWLLEQYTRPGDTVLDPFMGSGSTGVACAQTGRNFIGIEIVETYYKIAEQRIMEAKLQQPLFTV